VGIDVKRKKKLREVNSTIVRGGKCSPVLVKKKKKKRDGVKRKMDFLPRWKRGKKERPSPHIVKKKKGGNEIWASRKHPKKKRLYA